MDIENMKWGDICNFYRNQGYKVTFECFDDNEMEVIQLTFIWDYTKDKPDSMIS